MEAKEFKNDILNGLCARVMSECKELVSSETFEKIKTLSGEKGVNDIEKTNLALTAFFKELSEIQKAREIFNNNVKDLLIELYEKTKENLTPKQKQELSDILSP